VEALQAAPLWQTAYDQTAADLVGQGRRPYLSAVTPIAEKYGASDLSALCQ
jgi:hypothetical protein